MLRKLMWTAGGIVVAVSLLTLSSCSKSEDKPAPVAKKPVATSNDKSGTERVAANSAEPGVSRVDSTGRREIDNSTSPATKSDGGDSKMIAQDSTQTTVEPSSTRVQPAPRPKLPAPEGAQKLAPDFDVWIDPKQGVLIVDGEISLREGMLEMFACTRGTKEHESIISANTRAFVVHAGLLRLGAEAGQPVRFQPEYTPPKGTEIDITIQWRDENGKEQSVRAQDLVKDIRTNEPMKHPFVFAGSLFWKDEESGQQFYMAESGDFICVSNFSTAMLDIPVESSQSNDSLEFVALTEKIPPLGTPVRMVLKPKLNKDQMDAAKAAEKPGAEVSR